MLDSSNIDVIATAIQDYAGLSMLLSELSEVAFKLNRGHSQSTSTAQAAAPNRIASLSMSPALPCGVLA